MTHLIADDAIILASDEEEEYLILDIYDQELLNKANPLDGLAILNFESKSPTIVIGGNKHVAQSIPIDASTPALAIFNVDNTHPENVTGIGHISRHIVLGDPNTYRSMDPAFSHSRSNQKASSQEQQQAQHSASDPSRLSQPVSPLTDSNPPD